MNLVGTSAIGTIAGILALTLGSSSDGPQAGAPTVVVGTFDSRAILFAHVGSADFQEYLSAQHADIGQALERAKAMGDDALAAELEALGPAMQRRIHEQGFSTAPVDEILERIAARIPAIAEEAGVDVIVSKWALTHRAEDARFVDVTERLAAEFGPDEDTLAGMRELMAQPPVPLDQLSEDH